MDQISVRVIILARGQHHLDRIHIAITAVPVVCLCVSEHALLPVYAQIYLYRVGISDQGSMTNGNAFFSRVPKAGIIYVV